MDKNIEALLDKGDGLTKIHPFQLFRGHEKTFIHVHEALYGLNKGHCVAEPTLLVGDTREEFLGHGSSVEEALADCLRRIKGKRIDEISGLTDDA